ncbi:MAG: formate dehydrogenase accessory protein FdhE [Dehalococcoidales bacterium]|nr:formate dehydrogenase accessory protein FdhE [Dehalococcoidales bacterium]
MPSTTDSIIRKLEEYEKNDGSLPILLEFYKKLTIIQNDIEQKIDLPRSLFTTEAVTAHAAKGKPLLGFNQLAIDWQLLKQTYEEMSVLFNEYTQLFGSLPAEIRLLQPRQIINKRTVRAWYKGQKIPLSTEINDTTEVLLKNIFHAALKPFLAKEASELAGLIDQERWRRGYCPVCGGSADFGYLQKDNGARFLICNRCDTEWLFQRLQCPYCENSDQSKLSYFTDDKGLYRLYVCEQCRRYLKVLDQRQTEGEVLLPLERFLTLDIDRQAQERSYQPG